MDAKLSVREMLTDDVQHIVNYWQNASTENLLKMGADKSKLPSAAALTNMLQQQIETPYKEKKSYALIWVMDEIPIGHNNVNNIDFGKTAFMHLHIWNSPYRKKGMGTELVKKALPFFFENLNLKTLFCQPKADNQAPNKTLAKVGFGFEKKYITIPGSLNFEQEVNLWKMTRQEFLQISKK